MHDAAALLDIKHAAKHGRVILSMHAVERMEERGAQARDLKRAIETATVAEDQGTGKFRLSGGVDIDGDTLVCVVCRIQPGLYVVTIF